MKYVILLDSSNTTLTVGISDGIKLLDYVSYEAWQSQSEHMIPELNSLLDKFKIKNEEIDSVIVSIGPGSYTGVRIAVTIAKTIAAALKIDIYPVSSLAILKDNEKPSICLINARSERSYIGVYENENIILKDCIMSNADVLKYIKDHKNFTLCGNIKYLGFENYDSNVAKQMNSLIGRLEKADNILSVKPVYLKD